MQAEAIARRIVRALGISPAMCRSAEENRAYQECIALFVERAFVACGGTDLRQFSEISQCYSKYAADVRSMF